MCCGGTVPRIACPGPVIPSRSASARTLRARLPHVFAWGCGSPGGARGEDDRGDVRRGDDGRLRDFGVPGRAERERRARQVHLHRLVLGDEIRVGRVLAHGAHQRRRGRGRKERRLAARDGGEECHREAVAVGAAVEHVAAVGQRGRGASHVGEQASRRDRHAAPPRGDRRRVSRVRRGEGARRPGGAARTTWTRYRSAPRPGRRGGGVSPEGAQAVEDADALPAGQHAPRARRIPRRTSSRPGAA